MRRVYSWDWGVLSGNATYPQYFNISKYHRLAVVASGSDTDTTIQRGENRGCPFVVVGDRIFKREVFIIKIFMCKSSAPPGMSGRSAGSSMDLGGVILAPRGVARVIVVG